MRKQDLLQREEFVKLLESLIDNKIQNRKGFSFAIDGSWGCGKSFILGMLEKNLSNRDYVVIHYNCWDNDFYKEPLIAILSTIIDKLNSISLPETEEYKQKRNKINIAQNFLKKLLFMIVKNKFGVDFEEIGVNLDELKNTAVETLGADKKTLLSNDFDSNLSIKQTIKKIRDHLLGLQLEWKGIVFIVDELDRCLPNYAISVLERLHHICFDTENDEFRFIQLLAINRKELSDSIAKAFGKDITISNSKFQHDESQSFADYYLQKFIQLIIPVPSGVLLNDSFVILNGFENEFYGMKDVYKGFIDGFFSLVMSTFSMRAKIELVNQVKMVHQLTLAKNPDLHNPFFGVLAVELVDCLYRFLLKEEQPKLEYGRIEYQGVMFWLGDTDGKIFAPNKIDYLDSDKLKYWSQTLVYKSIPEYDGGGVAFDPSSCPQNYMKFFYVHKDVPIRPLSGGIPEAYNSFVNAFRETLDIIASLK